MRPITMIDELTLMVAGGFVSAIGCALLYAAWLEFRRAPAILWWAAGFLINALSVAALAPGFDRGNPKLVAIGAGLIPLGAAAIWAGTRAFRWKPVPWVVFLAIPVAWLASALLPVPAGPKTALILATMTLSTALLAAACVELWLGRAEKLSARWPLLALLAMHTLVCAFGVIDVALGRITPSQVPSLTTGFGLIYFELILFLIGSAVFIVAICRQRADRAFVAAARIDALTGVANRGSFFLQAARLLQRAPLAGAPVSLVAFDLDRFKVINDTLGHAAGDRVLKSFADIAVGALRPSDYFGRIGGDEFAAILSEVADDEAFAIAERIRGRFAGAPWTFNGERPFRPTVSAGVATAYVSMTLPALLAAADRELYNAKASGGNCVMGETITAPAVKSVN